MTKRTRKKRRRMTRTGSRCWAASAWGTWGAAWVGWSVVEGESMCCESGRLCANVSGGVVSV